MPRDVVVEQIQRQRSKTMCFDRVRDERRRMESVNRRIEQEERAPAARLIP